MLYAITKERLYGTLWLLSGSLIAFRWHSALSWLSSFPVQRQLSAEEQVTKHIGGEYLASLHQEKNAFKTKNPQ
jgi:hypothetical protein